MGHCIKHPRREAEFRCMKYEADLCRDCMECRDPKLYCKFRPACTIWFLNKSDETWDDGAGEPPAV